MSEFLNTMLGISLGALVLLALLSGAVGWVVAGRMLAPLSTMNEAAKQAASGDLSRRLALTGPRDEIRDLADTYDHMLDSLETSLGTYRRFAANASHELRTPLATAQTMIDVTLADPDASAQQLRSLAQRLRETNRANVETVDALLDLAEAQSGDVYREEVDLGEVVGAALAQLAPEASAREVALPGPPDGPVAVEGDPVLLRQAVSNLLRNAVRHNVPGGAVELSLVRAGGRARLRLSNGGPVVPAERLESLREHPWRRPWPRVGHRLGCRCRPPRRPGIIRQPRRWSDRRSRPARARGRGGALAPTRRPRVSAGAREGRRSRGRGGAVAGRRRSSSSPGPPPR